MPTHLVENRRSNRGNFGIIFFFLSFSRGSRVAGAPEILVLKPHLTRHCIAFCVIAFATAVGEGSNFLITLHIVVTETKISVNALHFEGIATVVPKHTAPVAYSPVVAILRLQAADVGATEMMPTVRLAASTSRGG